MAFFSCAVLMVMVWFVMGFTFLSCGCARFMVFLLMGYGVSQQDADTVSVCARFMVSCHGQRPNNRP